MDINEVANRRADLSTFLVHLTKNTDKDHSAKNQLHSILASRCLEARSMYGHLKVRLDKDKQQLNSQKTVCFTETPLEFAHLMVQPIENRQFKFEPYGIAITKRLGRKRGANPVWYVDMTPGHDWLTSNLDRLAERFLKNPKENTDLEKLFPFVEHMGSGQLAGGQGGFRKEFWWEREWRHVGNFQLPGTIICLCPEGERAEFYDAMEKSKLKGECIDPKWSLEKIIARLVGFEQDDIDVI
jgi:hypothetical protein